MIKSQIVFNFYYAFVVLLLCPFSNESKTGSWSWILHFEKYLLILMKRSYKVDFCLTATGNVVSLPFMMITTWGDLLSILQMTFKNCHNEINIILNK